jgi:hypothetical protein
MPTAIVTEELSEEPLAWLAERCEVVRAPADSDRFDELAPNCDALIVRTYTNVDASLLERLPNLRVVARAGVALDNIDVPACRSRGVEVVHAPGANSSAVAEYVFALLFDALRPRVFLDTPLDLAGWSDLRAELTAPRQLADCTLGIWGMGRIGTRVARIAQAFEMRAVYCDLREIPASERHGARPVSRDELLERAEIVTVHVDDRPSNRGLVGPDAFGRMRSDVRAPELRAWADRGRGGVRGLLRRAPRGPGVARRARPRAVRTDAPAARPAQRAPRAAHRRGDGTREGQHELGGPRRGAGPRGRDARAPGALGSADHAMQIPESFVRANGGLGEGAEVAQVGRATLGGLEPARGSPREQHTRRADDTVLTVDPVQHTAHDLHTRCAPAVNRDPETIPGHHTRPAGGMHVVLADNHEHTWRGVRREFDTARF